VSCLSVRHPGEIHPVGYSNAEILGIGSGSASRDCAACAKRLDEPLGSSWKRIDKNAEKAVPRG
jgi:hypothetical protein